jgi:ADP-ribosyl-[dinitrogen reductase] hydrolase
MGGDASAVGAVAGALAGAVYGETGIPPRWLATLQGRERITAVAERLADLALASGD